MTAQAPPDIRTVYWKDAPEFDPHAIQPFNYRPKRCPACAERQWLVASARNRGDWCYCSAQTKAPHLEIFCGNCYFKYGTEWPGKEA